MTEIGNSTRVFIVIIAILWLLTERFPLVGFSGLGMFFLFLVIPSK